MATTAPDLADDHGFQWCYRANATQAEPAALPQPHDRKCVPVRRIREAPIRVQAPSRCHVGRQERQFQRKDGVFLNWPHTRWLMDAFLHNLGLTYSVLWTDTPATE
ncbi:hypothetical protein RBB50_001921 [Rhinocladiella similis]